MHNLYDQERTDIIELWSRVTADEQYKYPPNHPWVVTATAIRDAFITNYDPLPVLAFCKRYQMDWPKTAGSHYINNLYKSGEIHARILLRLFVYQSTNVEENMRGCLKCGKSLTFETAAEWNGLGALCEDCYQSFTHELTNQIRRQEYA
jgi:hypothetical protein